MVLTKCDCESRKARCQRILAAIPADGLFKTGRKLGHPCRISPEPFSLSRELVEEIAAQGALWLKFLKASHRLYLLSLRNEAPRFISEYLDLNKPELVRNMARMNRFKSAFPLVLRPDLLMTDEGLVASELDSVPGGFGLLGCLTAAYEDEGFPCVGSREGIPREFAAAIRHMTGLPHPKTAIVVSEESAMYFPEMRWLASAAGKHGLECRAVAPDDLEIRGSEFRVKADESGKQLDAIYRFFELFDLKNVPHSLEILNAAKLKKLKLTPPPKANIEEKLLFGLLHHPSLRRLWERELGSDAFGRLQKLAVPTWILDPRPLPPHALIAGFGINGEPCQSWSDLEAMTQKERAYVIKPSGFSELAWGSRGVKFGPDMSQDDWARAVREALACFADSPNVLQPYRKPKLIAADYFDETAGTIGKFEGRVRLCPYYFTGEDDSVTLGGILATVCPSDKKAIHGMPEAIMVPCSIQGS